MKLLYFFLFIVLVVICFSACSAYFEKKIIFRPTKLNDDFRYNFESACTEFYFTSGDNYINGIHFLPVKELKGTILYFHGNSKNLAHWGENAQVLLDKGYEVYFYDYPKFGKSTGSLAEDQMNRDALNFYDYIVRKKMEFDKDFEASSLVLFGRSLGTTFASYVATKRTVKRLFLETPFNNMRTMFDLKSPFGINLIRVTYQFSTDEMLKGLTCPIHIIHGTEDDVVPYESAILLKPVLKDSDTFTVVQGGGHKDLVDYDLFFTDFLNYL